MAGNYSNVVQVQLIIVCHLFFFLLIIVLSVLLRFTASNYIFGIFTFFSCSLSCIDGPLWYFLVSTWQSYTFWPDAKYSIVGLWHFKTKFMNIKISLPLEASGLVLRSCSRHIFCINTKRKMYSTRHFSM